jgi:hypothetical protein
MLALTLEADGAWLKGMMATNLPSRAVSMHGTRHPRSFQVSLSATCHHSLKH